MMMKSEEQEKGLIIINKPCGKTSRDIVNELCHIFGTKKIGHTGTLDPLATGVLVCCIGKYTKLVNEITSLNKEYIAEIKLGIKTDTGDITGNIIDKSDYNITEEEIKDTFKMFECSYEQTVPKYSAVKINGKKLYEYARENVDIDLPKRLITVYKIELLSFDKDIIKFKARVSKGTYIRSLIEDICMKMNIVGTMNSLIRTKQGKFSIDESVTIEEVKNNKFKLLKIKDVLNYPRVKLDDNLTFKVKNGSKIDNIFNIEDKVIFLNNDKEIAVYIKESDYLKPYIIL